MVERTFAWLGQARRLAKDYERLAETGVAMIHWAMSRIIMLRRLTGAARRNASRRVGNAASWPIAKQFLALADRLLDALVEAGG